MATFRTPETEEKYAEYIKTRGPSAGCVLCGRPAIQTFTHWKIVENRFPYDKIAKVHHMLVAKEHLAQENVPQEAWWEFDKLKKGFINENYALILEQTPKESSIPGHFHVHLIVIKD